MQYLFKLNLFIQMLHIHDLHWLIIYVLVFLLRAYCQVGFVLQ